MRYEAVDSDDDATTQHLDARMNFDLHDRELDEDPSGSGDTSRRQRTGRRKKEESRASAPTQQTRQRRQRKGAREKDSRLANLDQLIDALQTELSTRLYNQASLATHFVEGGTQGRGVGESS